MPRGYTKELTSVHRLHYHFVWCVKYRKPVLVDDVAARLRSLLRSKAKDLGLDIINMSVGADHVHLFIEGHPTMAPNEIIQPIKGHSSHELMEEFNFGLPSLWTRSYFVSSTGHISDDVVDRYIEEQTDR